MKRKRLGEILEDRGDLTADSLRKLFDEQKGKTIRLGELILESGLVEKSALISALEEVSRVPYLDCSTIQCDRAALDTISASVAKKLAVLPIKTENYDAYRRDG
jgi:type IV pilus assembly protein PilB